MLKECLAAVRRVTVPVDMSSEQKSLLGIMSVRQLIYCLFGLVVLYSYVPLIFKIIPNIVVALIVALISTIPVLGFVYLFGFHRVAKYHMYFDMYLLIKFGYKYQIGVWRKGTVKPEWMEDG
jgi:hypothetical protein